MQISNKEIVRSLKLLGQLMELHEENPFKVKSINNAAFKLGKYAETLADKSTAELSAIEGVGKSVAAKIEELINTSKIEELETLKSQTPEGVIEMMGIKGLGPKKIQIIWKSLEIETIGELYYACIENRLVEAKGFGLKTQEEIKKLIEFNFSNRGSLLLSNALQLDQELNALMQQIDSNIRLEKTAELARNCEVITRLEFLANEKYKEQIQQALNNDLLFPIQKIENNSLEAESLAGSKVYVHFYSDSNYYQVKFRLDATAEHLGKLATINNDLISNLPNQTDREIYEALNIAYIPVMMREGLNEIEYAQKNSIRTLIQDEDLKGSLHNHSTWSDGIHSLEEMANYCEELGYQYLGICDHSKSAFYANGLNEIRLIAQHKEIDALNAKNKNFHIFKGIESDILNDGSLDYSDEVLKTFDFIVASIHSNLKMDEEKANKRLLKAIENPYTTMLGHPTGRLLLSRKAYPINHTMIIDACAANNVAIEINANPLRLDLDWRWVDYALNKGVFLSINPDAHKKEGYHDMRYGVMVAQKGGLSKEFCLNAFEKDQLSEYFKSKNK
jgi:DNA polymerase (family 10)